MKITLIRHTRVAVETGICYGWSDVGVAPSFETEASRVKENISNEQFDIVYSSPLSRCRKLAAFCGFHEPILDDRLKELNFGEWEMKKWDDLTDPRLELWYKDWIHLPAGGGESYEKQCRRVAQFLDELRHSGHTDACIFTHPGSHRLRYGLRRHLPDRRIIQYRGGLWQQKCVGILKLYYSSNEFRYASSTSCIITSLPLKILSNKIF